MRNDTSKKNAPAGGSRRAGTHWCCWPHPGDRAVANTPVQPSPAALPAATAVGKS